MKPCPRELGIAIINLNRSSKTLYSLFNLLNDGRVRGFQGRLINDEGIVNHLMIIENITAYFKTLSIRGNFEFIG